MIDHVEEHDERQAEVVNPGSIEIEVGLTMDQNFNSASPLRNRVQSIV